ncbi:hypothetical protein CYY_007852 [Polysphondylium violaceum]|uniref:Succinate dehydrogenase assembly factor 2, mitochondrial n=1 Tax=Polysphondylium violaceum TaxID=133409 RepID=A0A8J4UXS6_9MYCE|nr:hypothetical protein CYY_007852 [Polysphondylium violaceum]
MLQRISYISRISTSTFNKTTTSSSSLLKKNALFYYSTTTNISEVEKLRKKLLYQSKERGMLENDLLLGTFATMNIQSLTEQQLKDYDLLIQQPDPDILNWILEKSPAPPEFETDVLKLIQKHVRNDPLGYTRK